MTVQPPPSRPEPGAPLRPRLPLLAPAPQLSIRPASRPSSPAGHAPRTPSARAAWLTGTPGENMPWLRLFALFSLWPHRSALRGQCRSSSRPPARGVGLLDPCMARLSIARRCHFMASRWTRSRGRRRRSPPVASRDCAPGHGVYVTPKVPTARDDTCCANNYVVFRFVTVSRPQQAAFPASACVATLRRRSALGVAKPAHGALLSLHAPLPCRETGTPASALAHPPFQSPCACLRTANATPAAPLPSRPRGSSRACHVSRLPRHA